jgi:hypothetical protein
MKGVKADGNDNYKFKLASQYTNYRGNQFVCKKVGDSVVLVPISKSLAVRNAVGEESSTQTNIDASKVTKGEILKQLEFKLRTHQYQTELLAMEPWETYRIDQTPTNIFDKK